MTVMTKSVPSYSLVLLFLLTSLNDVDAYPRSDPAGDRDGLGFADLWPFAQLAEGNDLAPRREEVLQKMQEILGIRSQSENLAHRKVPPQFMMELYNTIADPSGVTRGRNPYNARVVRSFVERDTSLSQFYFFNISGLEINESVLEAELHLYRKKTPSRNGRPLTITSPYYLIRVYQVLDDRSLDAPDLHRLLNVRYVGAHASGWQVFNVKEAVLGWVSGEPNLGLLVTASNLFEDEASVEFSRRNDYHHSKQPILVLFDDDSSDRSPAADVAPRYYAYEKQDDEENPKDELAYEKSAKSEKIDLENDYGRAEHYRRHKRQRDGGQSEEVLLTDRRESEFFQRQKRRREGDGEAARHDDSQGQRRRRDAASSRKRAGRIVSEDRTRFPRVLTSMDVYERAMLREKLGQTARDRSGRPSGARQRDRLARSVSNENATEQKNATQECTRHELYVDFRDIGLSSSIIAPAGYSAYQCKGVCEPPLSQDQRPTNHATIQATVHKMGLVKGVGRPCCVPTKLLSTSILFYDDNENVVLKMYEDMIADRCGCR
ncbi:bone morphogenetic protein 2-like [Linepithema humile]|uniref:bone morphogenetic protein 2-like n=1 Tax=Linepithema humile TaxID=83485 RepID=UPI0006232E7D|nr:PREDICTED: bone morphogenetic protein 7-like [Linepithema humile]